MSNLATPWPADLPTLEAVQHTLLLEQEHRA